MLMTSEKTAGKIRVLVLDDEHDMRTLYRDALNQAGFHITEAAHGHAALQLLMQQSFDVLLVDLKLEGMNGMVFLEEALRAWPWLGAVIVSGHLTDPVPIRAASLGIRKILDKPVDWNRLRQAIQEEFDRCRGVRDERTQGDATRATRDHLRLLARLGDRAMRSDTLNDALREFGSILADMLTADAVGLLIPESGGTPPQIVLSLRSPVHPSFLEAVRSEMLARYEALNGRPIGDLEPTVSMEGAEPVLSAPCRPLSLISVPVPAADDFSAIVTLAAAAENVYVRADLSLLYHAANHISAIFHALRRMQQLATRDYLTGVFNRVRLEEELERAWLISRRYESGMAVLIVDIDSFKNLNDAYGHAVGDNVLIEFADLLRDVARVTDVIARYGGDEFVVILPVAGESDARTFAERLLVRTRQRLFCADDHNLELTCSIGISTNHSPVPPATSEELLAQADRALLMAKRAGRNQICIWPEQTFGRIAPTRGDESGASGDSVESAQGSRVRVAVVDDEPQICRLLARMLDLMHCEADIFYSADAALEAVRAEPHRYDIVLTDICLPGMSGIELLHEIGAIDDLIIRLVMTGNATVDSAVNSLREGAYDFIQKPVRQAELGALIRRALEFRYLRIDNARYQVHLEEMVRRRSAQLAASLEETRKSYAFTLDALVAMLDARERQTGKHSIRTRELAVTLARVMGVNGDDLQAVATGAFLHDIGKIGIPDAILLKPGRLEPEEWAVMKTHSEIGYNILRSSRSLRQAADIVRSHHERYDGTGYPRGLRGDAINLGARIFAVVDAYDTMRSVRVYRDPVSPAEACEEIRRCSGTQFDPAVVTAFLQCRQQLELLLTSHERNKDDTDPITGENPAF